MRSHWNSKRDFWHIWREEEIQVSDVKAFRNSTLDKETKKEIVQWRPQKEKFEIESIWNSGEFEAVGQDWILVSLLRPDRLLELVRHYVFFVQGIGKMIARYHQFLEFEDFMKESSILIQKVNDLEE